MKALLGLAICFCLLGCGLPEQDQRDALITSIEQAIRLPAGAQPMKHYARAYRFAGPDRVIAFYFTPDLRPSKSFCEATKKIGRRNGQTALACPPPLGMKTGERRWFDDDVTLPDVCDGGCSYIDVAYDVKSKKVTVAKCHGHA